MEQVLHDVPGYVLHNSRPGHAQQEDQGDVLSHWQGNNKHGDGAEAIYGDHGAV